MAIKDQCAQCSNLTDYICAISKVSPVYNQTSCEYYKKKGIILEKNTQAVPSQPTMSPSATSNPANSQSNSSQESVKQGLFSHPFSFEGRIRRTEFGISMIIWFIYLIVLNVVADDPNLDGGAAILMLLTIIPAYWFYFAQNCKRFHDRGNSGWNFFFYFIPFYNLYLLIMQLFADGDEYENDYGPDPKGRNIYS